MWTTAGSWQQQPTGSPDWSAWLMTAASVLPGGAVCVAGSSAPRLGGHCYLRIENAEGYVLIAVYLYACVRVIRKSQKVLNRITLNLVG